MAPCCPLDTSGLVVLPAKLFQLLRSGSLLHPLNRERLRQTLRQRPLEELQEELHAIQQAHASACGITLLARVARAEPQTDSSESETEQGQNDQGRAQPPVVEFVGRRPIFRVVQVEDTVSSAVGVGKKVLGAKSCALSSNRVESPEGSWEDMPFDKDTSIEAALADLSPRQILKARHVASNFGNYPGVRQAAKSVPMPSFPDINIEMRDPLCGTIPDSQTEVAMLSVLIPRDTRRSRCVPNDP